MNNNVFIVDDEKEVRDSLQKFFLHHHFNVWVFSDAQSYLESLDEDITGCLVSDIDMEQMDGLKLQAHLNHIGCKRPTVFITGYASVGIAIKAMKLGAFDFVEKPFDPDVLLSKVSTAIEASKDKIHVFNRYRLLTHREKLVFACVVNGDRNKNIAEKLFISIPTVEAHRAKVMKKMQADSLPELVKMSVIL
jgi:FixJ family two-component response regulator